MQQIYESVTYISYGNASTTYYSTLSLLSNYLDFYAVIGLFGLNIKYKFNHNKIKVSY